MGKKFAPLGVWATSLILFIAFETGLFFLNSSSQSKVIKTFSKNYRSAYPDTSYAKVIIIGSSLTSCALPAVMYDSASGQKFCITKWWSSGNTIENKLVNGITDELKRIKPALVCIQIESAAFDLNRENPIKRTANLLSTINANWLPSRLFSHNWLDFYFDDNVLPNNQLNDSLNLKPARKNLKNEKEISQIMQCIAILKSKNIKVKLLEIANPIAKHLFEIDSIYRKDFESICKQFKKETGIETWLYNGEKLYFKQTIDGAHLNMDGRKIYSAWLLNKVKNELLKP